MDPHPPVVVCVGPTGLGYYGEVEHLPELDGGAFTRASGTILCWDCAIVARLLASRTSTELITNNLGRTPDSIALRLDLATRLKLTESPMERAECPFDLIVADTSTNTRTWVSTGYFPDRQHISDSLNGLAERLADPDKVYLYVDAENGSTQGDEGLAGIAAIPFKPEIALLNLGDVGRDTDVLRFAGRYSLPDNCIFQFSLPSNSGGVSDGLTRDLRRWLSGISQVAVVATLGAGGALLITRDLVKHYSVTAVKGAFTVGAGAVLSAALLGRLMDEVGPRTLDHAMSFAVAEATNYVAAVTSDPNNNVLRLW